MTARGILRRSVLTTAAAASLGTLAASADTPPNPDSTKLPQPGDELVPAETGPGTVPLRPDKLPMQDLVLAWALDPARKIVRDGSRLNMVLLMRFDPAKLSETERQRSVDGVVAYSAVCTHQQCWATDWLKSEQILQCPCHQSRYDLRNGAKVVGGPAPRPLPALPLKLGNGLLRVAAPFTSRVGGENQQQA